MRAREIHAAAERLAGESLRSASVKGHWRRARQAPRRDSSACVTVCTSRPDDGARNKARALQRRYARRGKWRYVKTWEDGQRLIKTAA